MVIPVKPKLSATVILINRAQKGVQVYMTKRPETMKSYPGHYVFPGGKVMDSDSYMPSENILFDQLKPEVDIAFYVAAARELFEEIGVLLCVDRNGLPVQPDSTWADVRKSIMEGESSFVEFINRKEVKLNIKDLHYFGHRITSLQKPYRFNTKFFLADLPSHQEPNPTTTEIESGLWIKPKQAIQLHESGMVKMVMPTIEALTTLFRYNGEELPMLPVIEYSKDYF
ncbi:NUDIX domain-containing protein [Bacillus sp. 1P10SD]|uniref:NUDIX hydrolase n=1 Tax=Bacillus sp. 1P10SD TaxID=3132265 RepID=UPI0039A4B376